ncbi:hypothetical protein ALQ16_205360 [Pseudomonas syringae pv. actinidiae]|nr:hypothetical protein ALQ16_205360 [Pseudomonas syringae pv. actinidiae]
MIFLLGHFLAFAVGVLLISRRGQGQVFGRGHRDVALGVDAAGDHVDVATGLGRQVTSGADRGAQLRDAGVAGVHTACLAVLGLGRVDGDVAACREAQVTTGLQHTAGVFHVTTGLQAHVVGRFDAGCAVGEVLAPGCVIRSALMAGHRAFVDDVSADGGQCHITPGDDAPCFVDQVITSQQVQTVASFYQAAVDQVISSGSRQVIGRTQGADVIEVLPGNQRDVVTGNQSTGRAKATVGLGQVQHRHQHHFAIHFVLFEPDDVMGQRSDLL